METVSRSNTDIFNNVCGERLAQVTMRRTDDDTISSRTSGGWLRIPSTVSPNAFAEIPRRNEAFVLLWGAGIPSEHFRVFH